MFPISISPAALLAAVIAIGGISGLATVAIVGMRRNKAKHAVVDFETRFPETDGPGMAMFSERVVEETADRLIAGAFDKPIFGTAFGPGKSLREMKFHAGGTTRKTGFAPILAAPYAGPMTVEAAERIRGKFRDEHPDLYKAMAAELFPEPPEDPTSDLPNGVYWSIDAQTFCGPDGRAMDQAFAEAWWPRMAEFPQR